jgi:hypothetical protein
MKTKKNSFNCSNSSSLARFKRLKFRLIRQTEANRKRLQGNLLSKKVRTVD